MKLVDIVISSENCKKYLFCGPNDKRCVEAVYFFVGTKNESRICISTQLGCSMGCKFCATGTLGFIRNLSCDEMLEMVKVIVDDNSSPDFKLVNILLMGMGEPLLNFDNVCNFYFKAKKQFNPIRICLSTVGIPNQILKLSQLDCDFELFLSLHAPTDALRSSIMPINISFPISKILDACAIYHARRHKKIIVSYMVIKNVNDSQLDVERLARLLNPEIYEIQLLLYNENPIFNFKRPSLDHVNSISNFLQQYGFNVDINVSKGQDIAGACGQLSGSHIVTKP